MKKNYQYTFAIIGSGKIAKAFALILAVIFKDNLTQILFIGPRDTSNLSWFKEIGFSVSHDYQKLREARCIILAVTPKGTGTVLYRLKHVHLQPGYGPIEQYIVSFISGVSALLISQHTNLGYGRIITATTNTAIASGNGCICASGVVGNGVLETMVQEFGVFGTVQLMNEKHVLREITFTGSRAAFHAQGLRILHTTYFPNIPFSDWLQNLLVGSLDQEYFKPVLKYLRMETGVLKKFGYSSEYAGKQTQQRFFSTLRDMMVDGVSTYEDVDTYIAKVATKGGCTEKGITSISDSMSLMSHRSYSSAILTVHSFAKNNFTKQAENSLLLEKEVDPYGSLGAHKNNF